TVGTRRVRADAFTLWRSVEKLRNWTRGLQQITPRMWVVDLPMLPGFSRQAVRGLNRVVATVYLRWALARLRVRAPLVLTSLPYTVWLIKYLPRRGLVYYCTDDYSHWPSADRDPLLHADRGCSAQANLL